MMKKLLFYLLMLPLLCVLAACGEGEPNPDNPEETVPDPAGTNSPPVRRACTTDRGGACIEGSKTQDKEVFFQPSPAFSILE